MLKQIIKVLLIGLNIIIAFACGRAVTPQKSNPITIGNYDENLEVVRIKYENKIAVMPTENKGYKEKKTEQMYQFPQQINRKLEIALDSIASRNKNIKYVSGFRIQVYVGNEKKKWKKQKFICFKIIQN